MKIDRPKKAKKPKLDLKPSRKERMFMRAQYRKQMGLKPEGVFSIDTITMKRKKAA